MPGMVPPVPKISIARCSSGMSPVVNGMTIRALSMKTVLVRCWATLTESRSWNLMKQIRDWTGMATSRLENKGKCYFLSIPLNEFIKMLKCMYVAYITDILLPLVFWKYDFCWWKYMKQQCISMPNVSRITCPDDIRKAVWEQQTSNANWKISSNLICCTSFLSHLLSSPWKDMTTLTT